LIKFINIFVLFSFSYAFSEGIYFLERLRNTVFKSAAPSKSSSNWRVIVVDWRLLIITVNQLFALEEDGLDCLQILFVHVQKDCVLLLQFILNDWAIEDSFKAVKELEFAHYSIIVVKALSDH
jgi:hypothetical protein